MKKLLLCFTVVLLSIATVTCLHGQTFWKPSGLSDSNVTAIRVNSSGRMLACVDARRLYLSADTGNTWNTIPAPSIFLDFMALAESGDIYVGDTDADSGLQRSTDNGGHWTVISDTGTFGCYSLGLSPSGDLYSTQVNRTGSFVNTILHSTDHGSTWHRDSSGFNVALTSNLTSKSTYAFDSHGTMYAVGTDGLYRSTDNGATWSNRTSALQSRFVIGVDIDRDDHLYINTSYLSHVGGALRSTDRGDTWIPCDTTGLPPFSSFIEIASDRAGAVYGIVYGTIADGVYRSTDEGHTWKNVNAGLNPLGYGRTLAAGVDGGMFCGMSSGVFRSTASLTSVTGGAQLPGGFELRQNFPNPFNPETQLYFVLGTSSLVILKVYDVLGREVATLVKEVMAAGEHSVRWNAAGIPSGVYYVRMTAGNYTAVRKMLLVR
jgi:photosystem II stability/assembly factor-like uncharacterized protein